MTQQTKVLRYLQRRRTPVTRAEIVRALRIPHPAACRRVSELLEEGRAVVVGKRRGAETLVSVDAGK